MDACAAVGPLSERESAICARSPDCTTLEHPSVCGGATSRNHQLSTRCGAVLAHESIRTEACPLRGRSRVAPLEHPSVCGGATHSTEHTVRCLRWLHMPAGTRAGRSCHASSSLPVRPLAGDSPQGARGLRTVFTACPCPFTAFFTACP